MENKWKKRFGIASLVLTSAFAGAAVSNVDRVLYEPKSNAITGVSYDTNTGNISVTLRNQGVSIANQKITPEMRRVIGEKRKTFVYERETDELATDQIVRESYKEAGMNAYRLKR